MKPSYQKGSIHGPLLIVILLAITLLPALLLVSNRQNSLDTRSRASEDIRELSIPILSPSDDAYENGDANGAVTANNTDKMIHFGWYQGAIGLRFDSVSLSQIKNTSIRSAVIEITSTNNSSESVSFDIYAEKTNSCKTIEEVGRNITSRSKTTSKVTWNTAAESWAMAAKYRSPNIKIPILEVITLPGWESKNLCLILIKQDATTYRERGFYAKENASLEAKLIIRYLVSPPNTPSPPMSTPTARIPTPSTRAPTPSVTQVPTTPTVTPTQTASVPTPTPNLPSWTRTSIKKGVGLVYRVCNRNQFPTNAQYLDCKSKLQYSLKSLGITWAYVWGFGETFNDRIGKDIEFVPMVHSVGSLTDRSYSQLEITSIKNYATAHPGSYWLIWNEPDIWWHEQNKITDASGDGNGTLTWIDGAYVAGRIFRQIYDAIKNPQGGADPSAKLIIGGMADAYSTSLTVFPETIIEVYRRRHQQNLLPLIDGWHFHHYSCSDYNIDNWRLKLTTTRNWVDTKGGGSNKELWLTEFGCYESWSKDGQPGVLKIIGDQLDWLERTKTPGGKDVLDRYAWFAAGPDISNFPGQHKLFADYPFDLTATGRKYAENPANPITPTP